MEDNGHYSVDSEEIIIKLKEVLEGIKRIKLGGHISKGVPSLAESVSQ